jgi:hypothetical protein
MAEFFDMPFERSGPAIRQAVIIPRILFFKKIFSQSLENAAEKSRRAMGRIRPIGRSEPPSDQERQCG